jgi:glycosyltransferase involved in cell wall biosynthesis
MKIWVVTIGEPIPCENNSLRMHRTGIISRMIGESTDDSLVWWTSTFSHSLKQQLFSEDEHVEISDNFNLIALKGCGYNRNMSISRVVDHGQIAAKFRKFARKESKPDVIVVAFPTLGLCEAAIEYAKEYDIPVLLDYRDMWPEVFLDIIPKPLKALGRFLLDPLYKRTNKVFKNASGLIGITDEFLKMGLEKASRNVNGYDAVFPLAYLKNQFTSEDFENALKFWKQMGVVKDEKLLTICFFGTLGYQFDLVTVLEAAKVLDNVNASVRFILCGSGDKLESYKQNSSELNNVIFPGYIGAAQITALLRMSDLGLCPYYPKQAFLNSIPGKAIEYMSSNVPLLSTLGEGILGDLIKRNNIGFNYTSGSKDSLVETIRFINHNRSNLQEMHTRIDSIYKTNFDASEVYNNYITHLKNVVEMHKINCGHG